MPGTDTLDLAAAQEMLGISLRGWHRAAVGWVDAMVPDAERHLRTATRLLGEAAGREPLTVLADDDTVWAWLSSAGRLTVNVDLLNTELAAGQQQIAELLTRLITGQSRHLEGR